MRSEVILSQYWILFERNFNNDALNVAVIALNVVVVTLNNFCKHTYITVGFAQYSNKIEGIEERTA